MNFNSRFINPWKIYLICIAVFVLFVCMGIPLLNIGHSGGEQRPLVLLGYALNWLVYGMLLVSFTIPFLFIDWFKKYWYISIAVISICLYLITL